jgi:hypothetical protein
MYSVTYSVVVESLVPAEESSSLKQLRGRAALLAKRTVEAVTELADDANIRDVSDLKREISEDVEALGKVAAEAVGMKDAIIENLKKNLDRMEPDQLLFLALRAADLVGDKSFLESWKVIAADK